MTTTITGRTAITVADMLIIPLRKYADPTAPAADIDADTARAICREDPSLVYVDADEVAEAIDDHAIETLRTEADGRDDVQRLICERALAIQEWILEDEMRKHDEVSPAQEVRIRRMGRAGARVECARVIAEARTQAVRS